MIQTPHTGLTRILAQFGRSQVRHITRDDADWRNSRWFACDVGCRGL
jgi:hypothetical protein